MTLDVHSTLVGSSRQRHAIKYPSVFALDDCNTRLSRSATMVGLIGPDGVGKSSLLALAVAVHAASRPETLNRFSFGHVERPAIAKQSARASPTCPKGWARTFIRI